MGKYFKYNAGDVINGVLMIRRTQKVKNNWYGEFQCPCCGKPFEAQIQHIRLDDVKNCGCERVYGLGSPNYPDDKRNTLDLTNKKFGKWTALYPVGGKDEYSSRSIYWHCRCDCGTEKDVSSNSLVRGDSLSCGCYLHSYGEYKIREILNTLDLYLKKSLRLVSILKRGSIYVLIFMFLNTIVVLNMMENSIFVRLICGTLMKV